MPSVRTPRGLGDVHSTHRLRQIAPFQQRHFHARPVHLEPVPELGHRYVIDARCPFVPNHSPVRQPHVAAFDHPLHLASSPPISFARMSPDPPRHRGTAAQASGPRPAARPPSRVLLPSQSVARSSFLLSVSSFGPSVSPPNMACADFWQRLREPSRSAARHQISPGYCAPTFTLMRVGSTSSRSVHVPGFASFGLLTPQRRLDPLPVCRASASPPASFRLPVARETLAVQLTFPRVGYVEDLHLQVSAPCRAHRKEKPAGRRVLRKTSGEASDDARTHLILASL